MALEKGLFVSSGCGTAAECSTPIVSKALEWSDGQQNTAFMAEEMTEMDSSATIVTSRKEIANAIRACVPNRVLEVDPSFIDLAETEINAGLEPQFRTIDAEVQNSVRSLRGTVICAIPPGLSHGHLLLHLVHTVEDAVPVYAPLHELHAAGIKKAVENPEEMDPWFLTSVAAHRLTERLLAEHWLRDLGEGELPYPGWRSLFYLQLIRDVASPSWKRKLSFGGCVAVEIDSFGGTVRHRSHPNQINGVFEVAQKEAQAQWPELQCALNDLLRDTGQDVEKCQQELGRAYYSGMCSWPFSYGGVSYGERPIRVCAQATGLLRHLATPKPARKVIRLYRQNRVLFRSVSYFREGQVPLNPLPTKAQVQMTIEPQLPSTTLAAFLDRLDGYQLNLDFPSFLKLVRDDYIQTTDGNLTITAKGRALIHQADRTRLTGQRLYLILRLLENIQTDEASYADVLGLIQRNFQDRNRLRPERQTAEAQRN